MKATIDALSPEQRTKVHRRLLSELRSRNLTTSQEIASCKSAKGRIVTRRSTFPRVSLRVLE